MKERLFKLFGAMILLGSFIIGWLTMSYQQFIDQPMTLTEATELLVKPGSSVRVVARNLQQMGLVDDGRYFVWMARLRNQAANIQAGEYLIEPNTSPSQLLQQMVSGKVRQYAITLLEGWNFREMMAEIDASPYLEHRLKGKSADELMAAIGREGEHPEGRFFPDTYHFPRGTSDVDFLKRAYTAMEKRLKQEWQQRDEGLPLKSSYEALILASIVEKETGATYERPQIAGVFVRRLRKGMRLQTDPTVIYGIGESYDGNIRKKDLLTDTAYNTYTRSGLTPTPIAMPSGEAINAALHPDDGDTFYFVSRGDGSHHFSATLDEHNNAVIKYQLKGRKRPFSSYNPPTN